MGDDSSSAEARGAFRLVTLRSGARAVQHTGHGEVMHPSMGPWAEAQRLYVEGTRFVERLGVKGQSSSPPLRVWDVGLGAGTNATALLAAMRGVPVDQRRRLELHSFENDLDALLLALTDVSGFSYLQPWADAARTLVKEGRYEEPGLRWTLCHGDFLHALGDAPPAELVVFDPFSPKANPSLWTRDVFTRVRAMAGREGQESLLTTYSASTRTRVSLLLGGWFVGAGPSTGDKGETTVAATSLSALGAPLGRRWLERWTRSSARGPFGEELSGELEAAVKAHPQFRGVGGSPPVL